MITNKKRLTYLLHLQHFPHTFLNSNLLHHYNIARYSDCNWTWTQNHLVRKRTLNHLAKLAKWLNFRFRTCFEQRAPWHLGKYRVWIHSQTRTWHDKSIQSLLIISSFSIHPSNSFVTVLRGPITTGPTSGILSYHNLPIFLFKSWYFSTFSNSFYPTLTSAGRAISMIIPLRSFLYHKTWVK